MIAALAVVTCLVVSVAVISAFSWVFEWATGPSSGHLRIGIAAVSGMACAVIVIGSIVGAVAAVVYSL